VCQTIATTGAGSCTQDGVVCEGCTSCCSRQCAPYAQSGVKICQPASGCRLTNDLCQKKGDCCGGDPTAQTENPGNVECNLDPALSPPLGTCGNPNGCQARGNICGRKDGTNLCGGNAREDCCDCPPPKFNCCKPDLVGIFRCFGGGSTTCPNGYTGKAPCCIAGGDRCEFSAECCGGTPCVPDSQGVLRCLVKPPGGTACVPTDGACTTTGDCCAGMTCNITPGQTFGSCAAPPPPPPPPTPDSGTSPTDDGGAPTDDGAIPVDGANPTDDGGTPLDAEDAALPPPPPPACGFYGQACSAASACCTGLTCVVAGTITACDAESSCVCVQIIQ
jgi:hypothetical protein